MSIGEIAGLISLTIIGLVVTLGILAVVVNQFPYDHN